MRQRRLRPSGRAHRFIGNLLAILFSGVVYSCSGGDSETRTRVALITLDTLRYDGLAEIDGQPSLMPLTRARSGECVVFENFYSATSSTQPSHVTLFTDLHPWQHGVSRNGVKLADTRTVVAEMLQANGFATAAVVGSFAVSRRFGFAQGFDEFDDEFSLALSPPGKRGSLGERTYSLANDVTRKAIDAIDRFGHQEKQFYWFHYFDPHGPYGDTAGEATLRPRKVVERIVFEGADRDGEIERARRLYDEDCLFLDRSLDRLLQRLTADADDVETHVLIVSDHGESFGEDDSMAHGKRLTEGQIHVPLLICSPRLEPGVRHDIAGSIDITPTVLSLAELGDLPTQGRDLTRTPPRATRALGMRRTFETPFEDLRLDGRVHILDFNLFYMVDKDGSLYRGNARELLDRPPGDDEEEAQHSSSQLRALFGSFEAELNGQSTEPLMDPETKRALEALGYLQ